jgi:hypothetical protein
MTQTEFIPYEQAFDLGILGFDEPCLSRYCIFTEFEKPTHKLVLQKLDCSIHESLWLTKAPLYQQAFRWFREKYKLSSDISIEVYRRRTEIPWMFSITYLEEDAMYEHSKNTFSTYEEAELECLKKLIEIVKEKK